MLQVAENKIQDHEPSLNRIIREVSAIAKFVFFDRFINEPRVKVVDEGVAAIPAATAMPESQYFLRKPECRTPALYVCKAEELPLSEIAGMSSNQVEKLSLGSTVAVTSNSREIFWRDVHSDKMSSMISGSCIAGRSRAASSAKA